MSLLYVLKWFDSPSHLAVHTEMRDFEQPLEQTKAWVAEQSKPAAGVVYVLAQVGLTLTLRKSHVIFNQRGLASAVFRNAIDQQMKTDAAFFTKNAPASSPSSRPAARKKAKPGRKSPAGASRRVALEKNVGEVLTGIRNRKAVKPCTPGFTRGMQKLVTSNAQLYVSPRDMLDAMARFEACDWGDVNAFETRHNNHQTGARRDTIKGVYYTRLAHRKFVVVASPLENAVIVATPDDL